MKENPLSKSDYLKYLKSGIQGIEYLRKSQPGYGPMTERIIARNKANDLLLEFLTIQCWPVRYTKMVKEINEALLDLP